MENYKKIIFAIVAFLFSIHLSFVFIYNFDKITANTKIKFVVFKYMFPFFNQNNSAFVLKPDKLRYQVVVIESPPPQDPKLSYATRTVSSEYYNFDI